MVYLKGGYLAVSCFFVLSGYLSCISALRNEKFSIKEYYKKRVLHIYLQLLIVSFLTIFLVSFIKSINWLNLKPETTSVIFGYNNFWQIGAELDYFTRNVNSPFMHLWYIAILLQYDLVFPFIFITLQKIKNKFNKIIPCIIVLIFAIMSATYFCIISANQNIMISYYHTFSRVFSLLFGLLLGLIHSYYSIKIPRKFMEKPFNILIFFGYLILLICLLIFIDSKSILFTPTMIVVTLITMRLIDYATLNVNDNTSKLGKIIKYLSSICYEIYLVQYPVIFIFQYVNIQSYLKIIIMISIILLSSVILHYCINFDYKKAKIKIFKIILQLIILGISIYGCFVYLISQDHTKEMNELKNQLSQNEKLMEEKQDEYMSKLKEGQDSWNKVLSDLENGEENLSNVVKNLSIVGVGDSVMLGAIDGLYQMFPNIYVDAKKSRTDYEANGILQSLKNKGMLSDTIIINLGTNGDCKWSCKEDIMNTIEDRMVFWVNVTNDYDVHVNSRISELSTKYNNIHIVDWNNISKGHSEYFIADGIHLTKTGEAAYTNAIFDAIYNVYFEEYKIKRENIIKEHDNDLKNKISFYGNDILLNAFEYIHEVFPSANYNLDSSINYDVLLDMLKKDKENNLLTYKLVFAFDSTVTLTNDKIKELLDLCSSNEVYILTTNNTFKSDDYTYINFYDEINNHDDYIMADKIHLTQNGNIALSKYLVQSIIK